MIYLQLFFKFFVIGAFTFGGGYAMLPLIQQAVLENNWLTEQQIVDFIAVSESTPGPLAVNMSTYIGMRTAGIGGAVVATLGVVLPSFLIMLFISRCYENYKNNIIVQGAMIGLQPAVVALIATALLSVAGSVFDSSRLFTQENLTGAVTLIIASYLCYRKKHPILIIGISGLVGILMGIIN